MADRITLGRWPLWCFLAVGLPIAGACLDHYAYTPPSWDRRIAKARIVTTGMTPMLGTTSRPNVVLDVYEMRGKCPDLYYRTPSQGYRGAVYIHDHLTSDVALPGGEPIVLKGEWEDHVLAWKWGCSAALVTFLDEQKLYIVRFARDEKTAACDMEIFEAVAEPAGFRPVVAAPSIKLVGPWQRTPHATCTAANQIVNHLNRR